MVKCVSDLYKTCTADQIPSKFMDDVKKMTQKVGCPSYLSQQECLSLMTVFNGQGLFT